MFRVSTLDPVTPLSHDDTFAGMIVRSRTLSVSPPLPPTFPFAGCIFLPPQFGICDAFVLCDHIEDVYEMHAKKTGNASLGSLSAHETAALVRLCNGDPDLCWQVRSRQCVWRRAAALSDYFKFVSTQNDAHSLPVSVSLYVSVLLFVSISLCLGLSLSDAEAVPDALGVQREVGK